jgi:hypothetical protein
MHSEHLRNLHPGWVVGGWLVAIAVTSVVYLAMVGIGVLPLGAGTALGVVVAMAVGFFAGGLFVGVRWSDAPILHGAAITLVSVLVGFAGSFAAPGSVQEWSGPTRSVLGIILVQLIAATAGGWTGRRLVRGPEPGTG